MSNRELMLGDFAGAEGAACHIAFVDGVLDLILDKVEDLSGSSNAPGSFRLEFLGPVQPVLPQGTFPIRREDETMDIFIVPISQDAAGTRYEAVFTKVPLA